MAQHDYQIADQNGASFLSDLNDLLQAVVTNNSGLEPSPTFENMWWFDPGTGDLRQRNAANTAWVLVGRKTAEGWVPYHKGVLISPGVEPGTRMIFVQASAPTGWTQDTSYNDRVIRVVSNSINGGGTGGSWIISGLDVHAHSLTVSQLPPHTHPAGSLTAASAGAHGGHIGGSGVGQFVSTPGFTTQVAGEHTHNITGITGERGAGAAHSHGINHLGGWRPSYVNVIAATKD